MGQRAERFKAILVWTHEPLKTLLLFLAVIAALMATWYLWSARNSANVTGALAAKGMVILDRVSEKVDSIDAAKVIDSTNETMQSVKARVDALAETQGELNRTIRNVNTQSAALTSATTQRINQVGDNLASVKSVTDEAARQLKQNGDSANRAIIGVTDLEAKLGVSISNIDEQVRIHSGQLAITEQHVNDMLASPKVQNVLDDLVGTGGNVREITAKLALITGNFEVASRNAPEIADLITKMTRTTQKFQKALLLGKLLGLLSPFLNPFL